MGAAAVQVELALRPGNGTNRTSRSDHDHSARTAYTGHAGADSPPRRSSPSAQTRVMVTSRNSTKRTLKVRNAHRWESEFGGQRKPLPG